MATDAPKSPTHDLAALKTELEVQKLQAELTNLRWRWCGPALIQAVPATLVVLMSVYVAFSTGILDVKREHLGMQTLKLEKEKEELEKEKEDVRAEVASVKADLLREQAEVIAYQRERESIKTIRDTFPEATVEYLEDNGFQIALRRTRSGWDMSPSPVPLDESTSIALTAIGFMRGVQSLSVDGIELTSDHLKKIATLRTLKTLILEGNHLDDASMLHFPVLPDLTTLVLSGHSFTKADKLREYHTLDTVQIFGTPVTDDILVTLLYSRDTLTIIGLEATAITEEGMSALTGFPKLRAVYARKSSISEETILALARLPTMLYINVSGSSYSNNLRAKVTQINPAVFLFALDSDYK